MLKYYTFSSTLGAFMGLLVGLFVYFKNRKSLINITWFFVALSGAVWSFGYSRLISATTKDAAIFWRWFTESGGTLIPAFWLHFIYSVLNLTEEKKKEIIACYFFSTFLWVLNFTNLFAKDMVKKYIFNFYPTAGIGYYLFFLYFFIIVCYSFHQLLKGYKNSSAVKANQIKYISIGGLSGFAGGMPAFLLTLNIVVPPYTIILFAIYPFIFAYAIIRHHIMDIETVIHKTLMWLVASSFVFIPIVLFSYGLYPWYREANPFNVAVLCSGIFFILTVYLKVVQPKIDHLFQRRKYDLEKASERFMSDLVHLKSPSELIKKVQDTIKGTLYSEKISVQVTKLPLEDAFLNWLTRNDSIVYRDFVEMDPKYEPIKKEALDYFKNADAVITIPLVLDQKLLGLINLGKKSNLKHYNSYDFQFLLRLKNESTIALSNSLLYGRVEEEVQLRTDELIQTQHQLIQAEKLATVGTLAGGVAHEINNPLAAVLTNTQMLLMDVKDKDQIESLKLIEQATKRCREIIQKLMVYSRKPLIAREVKEVDLQKALNNVVAFLNYQLAQENIKLVIKCENPPFIIKGSQNELEQVFTNMILNAKDAIKKIKKSGEIIIAISRNNGKITIIVKDDGCGILKENIPKIFDPFFTTKDIGKGIGLGLSICQSIIKEHSGTISAESLEGEGAIFKITFT